MQASTYINLVGWGLRLTTGLLLAGVGFSTTSKLRSRILGDFRGFKISTWSCCCLVAVVVVECSCCEAAFGYHLQAKI